MEKSVELNLLRNRLAEFEIPYFLAQQEAREMEALMAQANADASTSYEKGVEAARIKVADFEVVLKLIRDQISELESSD